MAESLRQLIDTYTSGPLQLRRYVAGMTRDQLLARPVAGKWSTLEVVAHISDFEPILADRIKRHFDQVVDVRVILSIEKQKEKERRQRAECNIHVKGSDLFAESCSEDLYAAVDELVDKLDRQVVRHKDRLQDHGHTSPKRAQMA